MKSLKQIKEVLHEYIDSIEDEETLKTMYENTLEHLPSTSKNNETDVKTTTSADGEDIPLESEDDQGHQETKAERESRRSMARWFSDGGRNAC